MKKIVEEAVDRAKEEDQNNESQTVKRVSESADNSVNDKDPRTEYNEKANEKIREYTEKSRAKIHVVGTGGAGCNTVNKLMENKPEGCNIIAVNTDAQDLLQTKAHQKILIGKEVTQGLGAGNDPNKGEEAAEEDERDIREALDGADMVFTTCGLGGGTGTGSIPVIAKVGKKVGALTIGVVTLPFTVEGIKRQENAERGLEKLRKEADTVIVIPNDKLLEIAPDLSINEAFAVADELLVRAVKGITELITKEGLVNLDFADVKSVMKDGGVALIGVGESNTEGRAEEAIEEALNSPLIDVDVTGAKGGLINIIGGDINLSEAEHIVEEVAEKLDPSAEIIWGARVEPELDETLRVMTIISGVSSPYIMGSSEEEIEVEEGEGEVELDIERI